METSEAEKEGYAMVKRIADVSAALGAMSGVPGADVAGQIVSFLAIHPEHVDRFMREGSELFVDGTITPRGGCLTYLTANGSIMSPTDLRAINGQQQ